MSFDYDKANEMLKRAKTGDQEAFAYLYEAYYQHAYSGTEHLGTIEDREDATQEAFVKCFAKLQAGEDIANFGSYVKNAARNTATDMIQAREAKKRINAESIIKPVEHGDEEELNILDELDSDEQIMYALNEFYKRPDSLLFEKEGVDVIVKEVLDTLTTEQREALIMQFLQGYKQTEIADVYGVSVNTVKSYVNQGKAKAKKKILEIEKSRGIKIHGAAIVFVLAMFHTSVEAEAATLPVSGATFVATNVATKAAAQKGLFATIKAFFSKSVTVAGKTVSTKAIAIGTAGAIAVGTVGAVIAISDKEPDIYELLEEGRYDEACLEIEKEAYRDAHDGYNWDNPEDFNWMYKGGDSIKYLIGVSSDKRYREHPDEYLEWHNPDGYYYLIYKTKTDNYHYHILVNEKFADSYSDEISKYKDTVYESSARMDDSEPAAEQDAVESDLDDNFSLVGTWTGASNGTTIMIRFSSEDGGFIGIGDNGGNFTRDGDHFNAHVSGEYLGISEEECPGTDHTFTITPNDDGTVYIDVETDPSWNRILTRE